MTVSRIPVPQSDRPGPDQPGSGAQPERLTLSITQVLASGLAAVSATVAASYFGVAGTVIGAGLGSVISVVGSAVYGYSIRTTRHRVRQTLDVAVAQRFGVDGGSDRTGSQPVAPRPEPAPAVPRRRSARFDWPVSPRRLALAAGGLFAVTLAATTGFELASGQPLASTVTGKQGTGTSLSGGHTAKASPSGSTGPASTAPASTAPASTSSSQSTSGAPSSAASTAPSVSSTAPSSAASTPTGASSSPVPTPSGSAGPTPTSVPTG